MSITIISITFLIFFIVRFIPSDPARLWAGKRATLEQIEQARRELGLDKPVWVQYLMFLSRFIRGDLGVSHHTRRPVLKDLATYFPATFELTTIAMIIALTVGMLLGILSAVHKDSLIDHVARIISLIGVSMPSFWLGILLQLVFSNTLHIMPASGRISSYLVLARPIKTVTGLYLIDTLLNGRLDAFLSALHHMILPAITLSFSPIAIITRMVRSSLIEVLNQDYIIAAKSKGLPQKVVIYKHALRNALIPTTTVAGLVYGFLLAGSPLIEMVFDWPGLGLYAAKSALVIDYPAIMGVAVLYALIYLIVNLIVDIVYALIDPRVRYR